MLLTLAATGVTAQQVTFVTGASYSQGDYIFSERTRTLHISNGLFVRTTGFTAGFTLPLIYQNSPWISSTVVGYLPSGGTSSGEVARRRGGKAGGSGSGQGSGESEYSITTKNNRSTPFRSHGDVVVVEDTVAFSSFGVGDPYASFSARILDGSSGNLALTGGVKLPVASVDEGFGTGKLDAGIGFAAALRFGSRLLLLDASYWIIGDMNELVLNNPLFGAVGLGQTFAGGSFGLLISASAYTAIVPGTDPPILVGATASRYLKSGHAVNLSATVGLTESTPDFSVGLTAHVALVR